MAMAAKKIFVIALIIKILILLAYSTTTDLTVNDIRRFIVSSIWTQLPHRNFTYNESDVFVQRIAILKSATVASTRSESSRTHRWSQTTYMPSNKPGGGEPTRSTISEGKTEETSDQHQTTERTHLKDTKTRSVFQQIDYKQAWLYSAFFDHVASQGGKPLIRIFGIVWRNLVNDVYCNMTTRDGIVSMTGHMIKLPDNHGERYPPFYIECRLPSNTRPTHVSISFQKNKTGTNRLQIVYPGSLIRNFTVCYSILHSGYNWASQLIQSLEMNRILGAEHFVVYNYSISPAVDQILRRYLDDGLLTILPWPYPGNESWYYGQMTAVNDCFYRNRNTSRFIVVVDTDEFLIPNNHSNWMELVAAVSPKEYDVSTFVHSPNPRKKAHVKTGCFEVRSSYFPASSKSNWTSLPSLSQLSKEEKNNTIKHIFTLSKFLRSSEIFPFGYRTKYMARPELTYIAGVHFVHQFVNVSSCLQINPNMSLVHHYKMGWLQPSEVLDASMLRFRRQLYVRVIDKFKLFPEIFRRR